MVVRRPIDAADERRQPLDPVHKPLFLQELQRPIDRRRGGPRAIGAQPVEQIIGPGRRLAFQHQPEHLPPQRGQLCSALLAEQAGAVQRRHGTR